jgi:hypothetical protein
MQSLSHDCSCILCLALYLLLLLLLLSLGQPLKNSHHGWV